MGQITGDGTWEDYIYQFEETDVVKGGPDGIDNKPLMQLANRTAWLKRAIGYSGITQITGNTNLSKEDVFLKVVVINGTSGIIEVKLPPLTAADSGFKFSGIAYAIIKQVRISGSNSSIRFGTNTRQMVYLGDSDSIDLTWTGTEWLVIAYCGNFIEVGSIAYGYSVKANTIVAKGDLLLRSDYPRLWEYAQSIGNSLISDQIWKNYAGYKGYFSAGDGATNFRVPDFRGMFIRGLDLSAGLSYGRYSNDPGGYEPDEFRQHTHTTNAIKVHGVDRGDIENGQGAYDLQSSTASVFSSGGEETRPKNIGLLPLIKT